MSDLPLSTKFGLLVGLLLSLCGFLWLLETPTPHGELQGLGYISALYCSAAVFAYCWGAMFAYVVRKRNWSARRCDLAGLPLIIGGCCISWVLLSSDRWFATGGLLISIGFFANLVCRKLAYPKVTPEEMYQSPPPLSLFQK